MRRINRTEFRLLYNFEFFIYFMLPGNDTDNYMQAEHYFKDTF